MPFSMDDPFDLARFVGAQADTYAIALAEIRRGRKQSHWIWFIFPQFCGLGTSVMASRYAISSGEEATAYLAHPILGGRYRQCVYALQDLDQADPENVFGPVDARKLQSSLTLFAAAAPERLFAAALDRWFDGQRMSGRYTCSVGEERLRANAGDPRIEINRRSPPMIGC